MENKTAFDLNLEIRRWRENLAQAAGFRTDDLDELECHLRDSVGDLQTRSLSSEEAFHVAVQRIGSGPSLAAEFGSVNSTVVWMDRLLWMLIGWACISIFQSLFSSVAMAFMIPSSLRGFLPALIQVSPLILAALALRSLLRADGYVSRMMTKLVCKPVRLSLVFLAIGLLSIVFRLWTIRYVSSGGGLNPIWGLLVMIGPWLIVALFMLYLAEKRRRSVRA